MPTGEKLTMLMKICKINTRRLAQAIHVDPSSVSRWINGKRLLKENSEHVDKIADFFINSLFTGSKHKQQQLIDLILPGSSWDEINPVQLPDILREWLVSDKGVAIKNTAPAFKPDHTFDDEQAHEFLHTIRKLSAAPFAMPGLPGNCLSATPVSGEKTQVEVFLGDEGIQNALLAVVSALAKQDIPGELLITSQDDLSWYMHPDFLAKWMHLISVIIRKKNRIKVIFKLHRAMGNILPLLRHWLPLVLTGQVEAYFYPRYQNLPLAVTLAVAPGIGAMYSLKSPGDTAHGCSFVHRDFISVEFYRSKFQDLLSLAQPLIKTYSMLHLDSYRHELTVLENRVCDSMLCAANLNPLTLPSSLYHKLLSRADQYSNLEHGDLLALHLRRQHFFEQSLSSTFTREIYPVKLVNQMIDPDGYVYHDLALFGRSMAHASPPEALEHLEYLVMLLEKYDNYELALTSIDDVFHNGLHFWFLRDDVAVIISFLDNQGKPYMIECKESTVLQSFHTYFDDLWEKIPLVDRDKKCVLHKLKARIEKLKRALENTGINSSFSSAN